MTRRVQMRQFFISIIIVFALTMILVVIANALRRPVSFGTAASSSEELLASTEQATTLSAASTGGIRSVANKPLPNCESRRLFFIWAVIASLLVSLGCRTGLC